MKTSRRSIALLTCLCAAAMLIGCQRKQVNDYGRALPPGENALRRITDPSQLPDVKTAWTSSDRGLASALDRSIAWFGKPSTKQYFPLGDIEHPHARASVFAFREILEVSTSAEDFEQRILEEFDVYISVGWDNHGTVLFTGYYSPVFRASDSRTDEYRYPLYKRPADLVSDPATGKVKGRKIGQTVVTYPTRRQIEQNNMLAGQELVFVKSRLESYIVQVNGSAKLVMTDGSVRYIGYHGTNGHEYTSIGRLLVDNGKIARDALSLPAIRDYFRAHPAELDHYILQNDRFVFFQDYDGSSWPAGSLGVRVTTQRTLATDKDVFPRGGVTLVQTKVPTRSSGTVPFDQFMVDQDTGGAIRAAGRADIFMGIGAKAEILAGRTLAEGELYYFFLKPQRLSAWQQRMTPAVASY